MKDFMGLLMDLAPFSLGVIRVNWALYRSVSTKISQI